MKKFGVLFVMLVLLAGFKSCPAERGAELRILQINADSSSTLLEYGVLVPAEIIIRNLSLTDSFQGELKLTLSREIPYDEEFFCGGLDSESSFTLVTLDPGQIMAYPGLSFGLCRPGDYSLRAALESFPSDPDIKGNTDEKEETVPLQWEEFTDLSFVDPSPDFPMVACRTGGGYLSCEFYLWNVGNTPLNMESFGPEMAVTLTRPDGEVEAPILHDDPDFSLLAPHHWVGYLSFWPVQDPGEYWIEFLVDPYDLLGEASEENNRYLMSFIAEAL